MSNVRLLRCISLVINLQQPRENYYDVIRRIKLLIAELSQKTVLEMLIEFDIEMSEQNI